MAYTMDPGANLDWSIDWSKWLGADTIATSTWTVTGGTAGVDTHDNTTTTVWLSGGVAGTPIRATNHIITAGGRADERTIAISVSQR